MNEKLMMHERLRDLRDERKLTLEQLEKQVGISRAALGSYEQDGPKDISLNSVITLAQFYGVTTDYLLAQSEQKNHPDTEVLDLHLSDEMLKILKSGEINNRLLCEIVTHREFRRLLADIEIYVDRIASTQIDNLNAWMSIARAEILSKQKPEEKDLYLRTLDAAYIQENEYFTHAVHADIDAIIADIREMHKKDVTTADGETIAAKLKQDIEDAMQFAGSEQERQLRLYCNQLGIPYDKLTPEEFAGVMSALKKSKYLRSGQNRRGRSPVHRKGKRKKP